MWITIMSVPPCTTVFFDVASTLAFVQISANGRHLSQPPRIYPEVAEVLKRLREIKGVRFGFIFYSCGVSEEEVRTHLEAATLGDFGNRLLVVPGRPTPPDTFERAAALARGGDGCEDTRLLFVGTQSADFELARWAGFLPVPHPTLVYAALHEPQPLRYLEIRVPATKDGTDWIQELRAQGVVPLLVTAEPVEGMSTSVYAVGDARTAAALDDLGFRVVRLGAPGDPQRTELYLMPSGNASRFFASGPAALQVLASTHEGTLVAFSSETSIESFEFVDSLDEHIRRLPPSVNFFQDRRTVAERATPLLQAAAADPISPCERAILDQHLKPDFMASIVAKYRVMGKEITGGPFGSRHVRHMGNGQAVESLVADLDEIAPGRITVERHCFPHIGTDLTNVVATLPASDKEMERQGIVVISAHLDSTGGRRFPTYQAAKDPAPGADDDASGMAAVLGAARAFAELALLGRPHREVRFALFNAEEVGMSGSQTYAQAQAAFDIQAAAVFQIDMIGFDRKPPSRFEVHAGVAGSATHNDAAAARSADQAALVAHLRPIITTLEETEIFDGKGDLGATRSDHLKFHAAGYPACWVTQDFFPDENGEDDLNPAYHTGGDTEIMEEYAAQIARLVAAAAWIAATR
jgi:leucyl aminopeptidase